ncbi:hypothetical protein A4D02_32225 [Niastella koreensis]|uniref:Uncharacterized protein n=2 Tax=Niastella koreensis TaxID=354356 RepID=G8TBX6_NIAKG|nr:hypothetical protein [Niastella koreensis]AEV99269.1 hypothetical protein Niako_2938 [Niastella koreensis GR20-10]OQP46058.1 hypothetical protein A4D02_32225 [Niastella koreensis]
MKKILFLLILLCLEKSLRAQYIYTIKADSVKITNTCDTAELIIENHTQTVPGFLYNKGRGRTEFRRGLLKMSDSIFIIGGDTLRMNPWLQGGNRFGTTGKFGTLDNNHIDFYTNNSQRMRLTNTGNLLVGTNIDDGNIVQIQGVVSLTRLDQAGLKSPRFPTLIADQSVDGGTGFLFDGDPTSRTIKIGCGHSNNFHKFYFQSAGQPGDNIATYNYTYNGNMGPALNIFNFIDGKSKLLLTGNGNLLVGAEADNGYKLAVNGTTYSPQFTNCPMPIGLGDEGAIRLRWGGGAGEYISFYYQGNDGKRGYIGTPSDSRPLILSDDIGISLRGTPYLSIGTEVPQNARLSVTTPQNSTLDVFNASTSDAGYQSGLTVKASGNTVIGNNYYDVGSKLQVMGSAFIRDTLKMPNLVSQTDMTGYKPVVADASGNIYKMAGWNLPQINRTPVNDAGYSVQAADYLIAYTALSAARTVTLPAASTMTNRILIIKDESGAAGTYNIIINVVAGGNIDGGSLKTITVNYGSLEVYSNGSQWFVK